MYRRRKTSNVVPDQLHGSRKYRSLADIMQTTFPINVYSPEDFSSHNTYATSHPPDNIVLVDQNYHVSEDTDLQSLPVNENHESSTNTNSVSRNVVMVANTDLLDQMIVDLQHQPPTRELHPARHPLEPNVESSIKTISLGSTKVF